MPAAGGLGELAPERICGTVVGHHRHARLHGNALGGERLDAPMGTEADDLETFGMASDDVERVDTDRAGRAQHRHAQGSLRKTSRLRHLLNAMASGNTGSSASMRSSTPPCPGSSALESLTPAARLWHKVAISAQKDRPGQRYWRTWGKVQFFTQNRHGRLPGLIHLYLVGKAVQSTVAYLARRNWQLIGPLWAGLLDGYSGTTRRRQKYFRR